MTYRQPTILILFSVLLGSAAACKKKPLTGARTAQQASSADQPLASGFALKNAIAIQAAPEAKSNALAKLPIGSPVEIFATRVADQKTPDTAFWYKVKFLAPGAAAPLEGYISEREEVVRENFLVFHKKAEEKVWIENADGKQVEKVGVPGVMATTTVNLRKSPALNGAVIRQLKNGEVLKVLEVSTATVKIDDKNAEWYLVSDAQGATGYCFGGFLLTGLFDELAQLQDVGFRFTHGWVRIAANKVKALRLPVGADTFNLSTLPGADSEKPTSDLAKGALLQVDGETTKGGEPRYRVVVRFEAEPSYFEQRHYYVPKANVQFTGDYFTISSKQPHKVDIALARDLNRYLKGDVNLQCTTVLPFESGSDTEKRSFYAIKTAIGHASSISEDAGKLHCTNVNDRISLLVEKKDDKHVIMGRLGGNEIVFVDLDDNGTPEVISESFQSRAGSTLSLYAIGEGRLQPLFAWENDPDTCINLNMKGKYLVISGPEIEESATVETSRCLSQMVTLAKDGMFTGITSQSKEFPIYLKFEGSKFQKIDKPADLSDEHG